MRKLLILPLFFLITVAQAQLNNSWIDYNKVYYKFTGVNSGLYRIPQASLQGLGLASTPAEHFQLWHNGKQVRLFTSVAAGTLGASDYIEFFGKNNDGTVDNSLYRKPEFQLCDSVSLFTDTATYFLTVNTSGNNLRFTAASNNVIGNSLSPDLYFMRRADIVFRNQINRGAAIRVGEYVYSSSYDGGEGWTSPDVYPTGDLVRQLTNLNVYTSGPANSVSVYVSASGSAPNSRRLQVKLFDQVVIDESMNSFNTLKKQVDGFPLTILQNANTADIKINGTSSDVNDRIVVGNVAITYPATFNFNNQTSFQFDLPAASNGNYLEIENFNHSGTNPILFDLSAGRRYVGDLSTPGKVKFVLPASLENNRRFILVSQAPTAIQSISSFTTKSFINFSTSANQGDYIIITHPSLYNDGNGVNYVDQYKAYRSSVKGGSYNVKIIEVSELTDQFAFGIKQHPASIRDFASFAIQQFSVAPKHIFLIGRGTSYNDSRLNESNPLLSKIALVPTFGWPASDILLTCLPGKFVPQIPIGRLSVVNGSEIKVYLDKMKEYEEAQQTSSPLSADKIWMKNFMHVVGGQNEAEDIQFENYLNNYKAVAIDSLMGAKVETFKKESTAAVEQANGERIEQLFKEGLGFISYFGHSSANTLAFNLSNPTEYDNAGKYPFFNVSGCSAGNFFTFDATRLDGKKTLSEEYVLAPHRGSIAFLASTHLGIPPYLDAYNRQLYNSICRNLYGDNIGNQIKQVIQSLAGNLADNEFFLRMHVEQITLHGDPALKINASALPDYVIEEPDVKISPTTISVADNSFSVDIKMLNIGKAINDSIRVTVTRKLPDESIQQIYNEKIKAILNSDSLHFDIPINSITDKGLNQITVFVDADNSVSELFETNNQITKSFYIYEDELRPVYPYNYSIVNQQNITFSASTANPLTSTRQYIMEVDTTELFNSPFKKQYSLNGIGGVIEFKPTNLTFVEGTVYYWRTSIVPVNANPTIWNGFSFVYLANSSTGFNQSHYYQHLKSAYEDIVLDQDRKFKFKQTNRNLQVRTGLYPYVTFDGNDINLDFDKLDYNGCNFNELQIVVYDTATLMPWRNYPTNNNTQGSYGSLLPCDGGILPGYRYLFEFPYDQPSYRKKAIEFLESIPSGFYVSIVNFATDIDIQFTPWLKNNTFISDWQTDQTDLGAGKSLYHTLKNLGFEKIDSFYKNRPFLYFFKKNSPQFTPQQFVGENAQEHIIQTFELPTTKSSGTIQSPLYGPAKKWYSLHWRGTPVEVSTKDSVSIEVHGVKSNGTSELLATVVPAIDSSLAFIDAAIYPYIRLKMNNTDSTFLTPQQLTYWRINADYLPEGAVAPNILYSMKDTIEQGEKINISLAFKNVSQPSFDSIRVKFIVTDKDNVPHEIVLPRLKTLVSGDTATVNYSFDSKNYAGNNTLYIMFNSDNDQPEQFLFNNFIYKDFFVKSDDFNPLLDVTFDGVHILNRDIVSASPNILIKLKDESKFLALADTALLKVQLIYPDETVKTISFGEIMQFYPANLSNGENTASIQFNPTFTEDGEYELVVSGKDVNGNKAGEMEYRVVFTVINKPMISNLLNYPNPFTTSTAFVFYITGSEVPQNMRIQILTITGKVVREITKDELGPLNIGRNITQFKWDGTDSYGQKLANGVYLYRVLTNLNGKSLGKYKASGDKTDTFFNKGYGKMYLMR
jgi:hypothetical protein